MNLTSLRTDDDIKALSPLFEQGVTLVNVSKRRPNQRDYPDFNETFIKVDNITHEVHYKGVIIALFCFVGLGHERGYIVGANNCNNSNHDLSRWEVAYFIQQAAETLDKQPAPEPVVVKDENLFTKDHIWLVLVVAASLGLLTWIFFGLW